MFKDASIFETQKLKQVVNWTELFLDKHHTGDSMQEISPSFGRSALEHDAEKKVTINTINKKPEYFDVKLLHAHISNGLSSFVVSENILEQTEKGTPPALLDSSILNSSLEEICPTQITKYDQEHQNKRQGSAWGECEVDDHKHSTGKKPNVQNSYIVCKGEESFSTTIDLHENLDYYFWAPLNDSSDEEWTDVVRSKSLKRPDTLAKTYTDPPCNTGLLKSDHKKTVDVSVLADGLPSARSASSVEKGTVAAENLAEIKERDHCKDFIWILKPDSSRGTSNNAESTIGQVTNGNIPFDPETQKDALCFLDFQSQKKGTVQKKESKLVHVTGMDKSFEDNKCVGKEQANSPSNGKNCTGDQTGLELQPLKKNKSMLISNLYTNILLKPLGDTACKVSPGSFDLHNKDNYGCVEGGSVTPISIPKYKQDDINEYVSEDVTKSTVGPKSSSEEILIPRTKVVEKKKLFGYDKCLSDSHNHDSVLAQYYFYLNYLSWSKRLQLEEVNHSFSCEELHRFSQEENFSANYHFKNNNKDAEDADSDSGPSGMSRTEGKRTEAIKPQGGNSEEQESKPSFTNTCHTPLLHRALTDKRDPRSSKDKIVPEIRKISTNVANNKRHWERSGGTAGSSCTHGERKQRSRYVHRTTSVNENRRKDRNVSWSLPFSGKESRQQHGAAIQGDEERNVKSDADSSVLSWLLLPDELWLCIFSLLTHKDISQVSQVCHRFYQLAADDSFWKEIKLVNCHCLNDSWLVRIGSHHPQRVTLDHCHSENQRITEVGLRHFFQQCKGSLKELNIKNCTGPGLRGDTILLHASTFCNLLTTVDISWTGVTDSRLIDLVTAAISLQCLSANGCQITDSAVAALAEQHGKSLRKLEIFGCYGVTAKCIKYVAMKCPDIKVLNIGRIPKVTEDCLEKVVNAMKKLTSLNITGLNVVKDCVVHFIAKKCPQLEGLVLNSCSQVTDLSLLDISMYLPTIRYLDVSGCKEVTDDGVQALAERCHKLSYLDLSSTATSKRGTLECVKISFCKAVTPDAAAKLCKNCKRLKILHLYGCQFMPDVQSLKKINKTVEVFHDLAVPTAKLSSE